MIKLEWEDIKDSESGYLRRAKIPGGWLVKMVDDVFHDNAECADRMFNMDWRSSICFVPDPEHLWGNKKEDSEMPETENTGTEIICPFCNARIHFMSMSNQGEKCPCGAIITWSSSGFHWSKD